MSESSQIIELWEVGVAVTFFTVVLGGIFVAFDSEVLERELFIQDLREFIFILPQDGVHSQIVVPEFLEIQENSNNQITIVHNDFEKNIEIPEYAKFNTQNQNNNEEEKILIINTKSP